MRLIINASGREREREGECATDRVGKVLIGRDVFIGRNNKTHRALFTEKPLLESLAAEEGLIAGRARVSGRQNSIILNH